MSVTLEDLQKHTGKELSITVSLDGEQVTDKFILQGALPQGIVLYRKKLGARLVQIEDIASFDEPAPEPVKLKIKNLKDVTVDDVAQHVLDRHGATVEWVEQSTPEAMLEWHTNAHASNHFGHAHKSDKQETPAAEQAAGQSQAA